MTLTDYSQRYMLNGYHRIHESDYEIEFDTFIEIVRCARQLIKHPTLGNVNTNQGRKALFRLKINENMLYKVHADTKIDALRTFYENALSGNRPKTVNGPAGASVLSNTQDDQYIEGLYIYKI